MPFDMRIPNIPTHLLDYEINPKAFINAHNFPNFQALLEEVKRIDSDSKAYESMLAEPIFLHDFNPGEFYLQKVLNFLEYIIEQGKEGAKRVGASRYSREQRAFLYVGATYGEQVANSIQHYGITASFLRYCARHKKSIESMRAITEFPRSFSRFLRGK